MNKNLLAIICSNSKKKPYLVKANQIGVTRNAVAINPLTGYNVSTGNVMTQVANSSVNNIVNNGDFSSGATGWGYSLAVLSVVNNECTVIPNTQWGRLEKSLTAVVGHKYYTRALVTGDGDGSIYQTMYNANGATTYKNVGGTSLLSSIKTPTSTNVAIQIGTNKTSNFVNFTVKQVAVIDLTATFGVGFEPTQAWCDANIPFFNGTLSNPPWIDPLVTHNQYGYVGGDTTELTFDFGTKVAGSVVECPMKVYRTYMSTLQPPTNITSDYLTGFKEFTDQTNIDLLKSQENSSVGGSYSTNGVFSQFLIELDLTPVVNQLFGGSNSALSSALKSISADVWCTGSGSNVGVLTNGVNVRMYSVPQSQWMYTYNSTSGSVTKVNTKTNTGDLPGYTPLNSSNKIYILIDAQYPSNGTIASSVSLDYVKITIGLNRTVDTVTPKSVMLPKYWAMLVKGFSPSWDNTITTSVYKRVFELTVDLNNRHYLFWHIVEKKFYYAKTINGVTVYLGQTTPTFNKNQIINFIVGYNFNGMFLYVLKNNGTFEKYTITTDTILNGTMTFTPLCRYYSGSGDFADSFAESFQLYDLKALGKSSTKNMIDMTKAVTGYITTSGELYPPDYDNYTSEFIPVNPNTTYTYYAEMSGPNYWSAIAFYDSNKTFISRTTGYLTNPCVATITTGSNVAYVRVGSRYKTGGKFQFELGSMATTYEPYSRVMGFTDYEAESILRGDNKYYQTTTSDYNGKISGSFVENPNVCKYSITNCTSLLLPTSVNFSEQSQPSYDFVKTLNGTSITSTRTLNGDIPQHSFSFNIIEIVERKYGPIPNCSTVAEKVAWLKVNTYLLSFKWYGCGNTPTGNKAYIRWYDNNAWNSSMIQSHVNSTVTGLTLNVYGTGNGDRIYCTNDGFVHFIAYTDASNGVTSSILFSDYCSLDVTVKTGNTSVCVPQKELFDINAVNLNIYATRSNGIITLNATGSYQESTLYIPVLPNNQYVISGTVTGVNGYIAVREYLNNSVILKSLSGLTPNAATTTFTTGPNTNCVRVLLGSSSSGTFTFNNISLKLKM